MIFYCFFLMLLWQQEYEVSITHTRALPSWSSLECFMKRQPVGRNMQIAHAKIIGI